MRKFKRLTLTLALLLTAVGGAWAGETPLLTIESKDYTSFTSGSKTFDEKVTVTFSDLVYNDGDNYGWYAGGSASQLTVSGTNGYTITSCKFYTEHGMAETGYPVEGESPSVYLSVGYVYTDANQSLNIGESGVTKIEVYGYKSELTEWALTPDQTGKTWTLAKMPAYDVELQVEYEPTKVAMAANDNAMGTVEVAGESKVEWTADTWKGWTSDIKEYTVDDITMTSSESARIREYTSEDKYNNSLFFFVRKMYDDDIVTFSTTGDPFSRIEFTMIGDYSQYNPDIIPNDNWTVEGKSAVWEGEATKSLTLQSCSTQVSKITFFKGATPDGVTVNGDGTFTVAKTATVTLKATPAEGYKFLYWEDDQTNTNPVRKVTIESGMADMTYKAVFAEILYNVTFVEGTNPDPENPEWTATPNPAKTKQTVTVTYTGRLKVKGVKALSDAAPAAKPAATVTTAPTGATGLTTASAVTEKLVTGGVADGGTLKYAITSTTTQPDDAAFTLTISPTVSDLKTALSMSTLAAGTYYVWYKVFADADHADSEAAYVSVAVAQVITWNSSNISDLRVYGTHPYTKGGITLSANGMSEAAWQNHGAESGIRFEMMESGGYTFTAPTGQKFTKIEMTLTEFFGWDMASLGTGWAFVVDHMNNIYKVTWTGNAASTVGLLTDASSFYGGGNVKSIVFSLVDAE